MSSHLHYMSPIEFVFVDLVSTIFGMDAKLTDISELEVSKGRVMDVDAVIEDKLGNRLGIKKTVNGKAKIIPGCTNTTTQAKSQKGFYDTLRQKYSYGRVVKELKNQGYVITGEKKEPGATIKITARKY